MFQTNKSFIGKWYLTHYGGLWDRILFTYFHQIPTEI